MAVDDARRRAVVTLPDGTSRHVAYDVLVIAPGAIARELPVPGLSACGLTFRTVGDAAALRDHVLSRLDAAASVVPATAADVARRARLLTFVVVGGGFAGVEALGELEDLSRRAAKQVGVDPAELRWVLVEAARRIMPEVTEPTAARVHGRLARRGIEVRVGAGLTSALDGEVPPRRRHRHPDRHGRPRRGHPAAPAARAHRPAPGAHRQGPLHADAAGHRRAARVRGRRRCRGPRPRPRRHPRRRGPGRCSPRRPRSTRSGRPGCSPTTSWPTSAAVRCSPTGTRPPGVVAGLGRRRGVAEIRGLRLMGWPAYALHRAYHLWAMPTAERKARIVLDWVGSALLGRDPVAAGAVVPAPRRGDAGGRGRPGIGGAAVPTSRGPESPTVPGTGVPVTRRPGRPRRLRSGDVDQPTLREPHPSLPTPRGVDDGGASGPRDDRRPARPHVDPPGTARLPAAVAELRCMAFRDRA